MTWIKTIGFEEAEGPLKKIYDRVKGPDSNVDNILVVHSLRPHSLTGHMALYKNVLHNTNNSLPKWYLETLGVYVSYMNECEYCVDHHFEGLKRLLANDDRADELMQAIMEGEFDKVLPPEYDAGTKYARKLTIRPNSLNDIDLDPMRRFGMTDGEILEINQVVSYFNYVNRTVLGLGVTTRGDVLGLSPNEGEGWEHS